MSGRGLSTSPAMLRFTRLPEPSYEKIFADANTILDDIISQCHTTRKPHHDLALDVPETVHFIVHGCKLLHNASILLRSKFAQVLNIYLIVIKSSLTAACVNELVVFLVGALNGSKSSPLVTEFMRALSIALHSHGSKLTQENITLLLEEDGILWPHLKKADFVAKGFAIQCIGNIAMKSSDGLSIDKDYVKLCYSKLLDCLHSYMTAEFDEVEHFKVISTTLRAIQNVLTSVTANDGIIEAEFIVAMLKVFLVYGMANYQMSVEHLLKGLPMSQRDSLELASHCYPRKKEKSLMTKKVHPRRPRKKKRTDVADIVGDSLDGLTDQMTKQLLLRGGGGDGNAQVGLNDSFSESWRQPDFPSSSESEFSDSDASQIEQLNGLFVKIRENAAKAIQLVLYHSEKRSKFACWLSLTSESIAEHEPTLVYSLVMEQSTKVRSAVLMALMEMINGSKGFLESAVNPQKTGSHVAAFIPYSEKLSQSLALLHNTLHDCLEREMTEPAKERVVKCFVLLILNAPYNKIGSEYLSSMVMALGGYLYAKDLNLRLSTLTGLAAIMTSLPGNWTVFQTLETSRCPGRLVMPRESRAIGDDEASWLVTYCLQQLACEDEHLEVQLTSECIQLLTVVMRTYPSLLKTCERDQIVDIICNRHLRSPNISLVMHSIKILAELSKYFAKYFESDVSGAKEQALQFWERMLSDTIVYCTQALQEDSELSARMRSATCDWIATIGAEVFTALQTHHQIFLKSLLIGLANSEHIMLSAASVRALGLLVEFPCMKEDIWFVVDVSQVVLNLLKNTSAAIRMKAGWTLANICDFLAVNDLFIEEFPQAMLLKLLQAAIQASSDNERISSNGVRAIGNLLKKFPQVIFENTLFIPVVTKAVEALAENIQNSQMKSRWNACYACHYFFENPDAPIGCASWSNLLFTALLSSLRDCKNFKVRISAATSLCTPRKRSCYGDTDMFVTVWRETFAALTNSEEMTDFSEFRYKENLQDQVVMLLLHLLSLADSTDRTALATPAQESWQLFAPLVQRLYGRVQDSRSDTVISSKNEDQNSMKMADYCRIFEAVDTNLRTLVAHSDSSDGDQRTVVDLITTFLDITQGSDSG